MFQKLALRYFLLQMKRTGKKAYFVGPFGTARPKSWFSFVPCAPGDGKKASLKPPLFESQI
jgi:hypothetical protein